MMILKKKCKGVINIVKDCPNGAEWISSGYSAQFGVCHTSIVCDSCKEVMENNYRPKILEYNRFPLTFKRLE